MVQVLVDDEAPSFHPEPWRSLLTDFKLDISTTIKREPRAYVLVSPVERHWSIRVFSLFPRETLPSAACIDSRYDNFKTKFKFIDKHLFMFTLPK